MEQVITDLFMACVYVLQVIGGSRASLGTDTTWRYLDRGCAATLILLFMVCGSKSAPRAVSGSLLTDISHAIIAKSAPRSKLPS